MDKIIQDIIPPVSKEVLKKELTEERFLRHSSKGGNHLYLISNSDSPNVMREIGRLRELTFREAGGGTGKPLDVDDYDMKDSGFQQLIAWDPDADEIIAGYRLLRCDQAEKNEEGEIVTATSHLFRLSNTFNRDYLPYSLELGRSFVQPKYQSRNPKGLFSLDNLWDGLGAVLKINPEIKYFIGKVTMYPEYNREGRNMLLSFMHHYFPDNIGLAEPIYPLVEKSVLETFNPLWEGKTYKEAYVVLNKRIRELGENIPPLINSYMNLTGTMKTFGTSLNPNFGDVEETGILVTVNDIHADKQVRYLDSYEENKALHK